MAFLYSCNRTSEIQDNTLDSKTQKILTLDAKKLATEHNNVLKKIAQISVAKKSTSKILYTEEQIYNDLMAADVGLDTPTKIEVYDYIDIHSDVEENMISVANNLNTQQAKNLYLSINNQIDLSLDYNSIINVLDANISNINNITDAYDKQVLNIFAETCRASAYYWYVENPTGKMSTTARATPKWVRKDGNGIAQASIGWAVVAAAVTGPASPASYFISYAVGGALASIWPD